MEFTLKKLMEILNEDLTSYTGTQVQSPRDVCNFVRQAIKDNEMYKSMEMDGLDNLFIFKDDITEVRNIYLRTSEMDTENMKRIIQINMSIAPFDESNPARGGILNNVNCVLVDVGKKIQNMPLQHVVTGLQLSDIKKKQEELLSEMTSLSDEIASLQKIYDEKKEQNEILQAKIELLQESLTQQPKENKEEKQ